VGVTRALPYCCTLGRGGEVRDLGRKWQLLVSGRNCRLRDSVLFGAGLGSPSAQSTLVIALSEWHTPRAQDVVCGDSVEIKVGQRKRKDEGL
jgi:hypothetical protein